jgi:co-chaperonin GroES (HSP10)
VSETGVRLERKRNDWVDVNATIRPLRDRIVLKPLDWQPSNIISIAGDNRKPLRGVVVAVGPGYRQKRWKFNSKGERCGMGETGRVIPIEVKPGDVVELGGLELNGYDFPQIVIGNELHVICQEQDVVGIVEPHG